MFGLKSFASAPFSSSEISQNITGTLSVALDDVSVNVTGVVVHTGTLSLTTDGITFNASGLEQHTGTLSLTTDDITFFATGSEQHTGTLSLTLDDVVIAFSGEVIPQNVQLTHGGYPKKKIRKNQNAEIEQTIRKIIDGEPEPEIVEEVKKPEEVDFSPYISELVTQARAEALNLTLQEYMRLEAEAEADDEEALFILLGGF